MASDDDEDDDVKARGIVAARTKATTMMTMIVTQTITKILRFYPISQI